MDPHSYGKAFDGIAKLAYIGIAAIGLAVVVLPIGCAAVGLWAWNNVEVRVDGQEGGDQR